jgi:hypothetical protein
LPTNTIPDFNQLMHHWACFKVILNSSKPLIILSCNKCIHIVYTKWMNIISPLHSVCREELLASPSLPFLNKALVLPFENKNNSSWHISLSLSFISISLFTSFSLLPSFLSLLSFFSRYFPPSLSLLPSLSLSLNCEEGVWALFTSQREREREREESAGVL